MEIVTDERAAANAEARKHLTEHVFAAVKAACDTSPTPQLVLAAAPMTMAAIGGSYILQLLRARVLADGEADKVLGLMAETMREHADPSLTENDPVELTDEARAFLRGLFGRG